jgi:multiple sugar transport system substrate-binding protein
MLNKLSRRVFLRVALATAGSTVVAACQPKVVEKIVKETVQVEKVVKETVQVQVKETVQVEKVVKQTVEVVKEVEKDWPVVRWAGRGTGEGYDQMMELIGNWEIEHRINFVYEPIPGSWDDVIQKMMAGFAAGDAPDVWRMYGPFVRKCIEVEIAMNITPFFERDGFEKEDFVEGQLLASQKDKNQYGVPDYCGIWGAYYNVDMLEEAGLPLPTKETWSSDMYREYSVKLTKRDASGMLTNAGAETNTGFEFGLSTAIWSYGAEITDADRVACKLSDKLAMEALKFKWAQKWEDKVTPSPAESAALNLAGGWGIFNSGAAAFHENGSWFLCNGCGNIPAIGDKFRYAALPHWKGPTGKRVTFCTTDTWMGLSKGQYPDAIWEFLKLLASKEMQTILAKYAHLLPARRSVVNLWEGAVKEYAMKQNPKLTELDLSCFVEGFNYCQPMFWWKCNTAVMEILQPVLDQIYTTNSGTVDELIPKVCQEISAITCE